MALEFHTGFEGMRTGSGGDDPFRSGLFTSSSGFCTITSTSPRNGTKCLDLNTNHIEKIGGELSNAATRVLGFGVKFSAFSNNRSFAAIGDGTLVSGSSLGNIKVALAIRSSGAVAAYRNMQLNSTTVGTQLGSDSANVIALNTWYFFELVVTHHASAGTVELFVNGSKTGWIDLTGQNTSNSGNAYSNSIGFGYSGSMGIDDVYTVSGTGGVRTTRLGDCKSMPVYAVPDATATGTYGESTPLSGTDRGAMVDETSTDEDTTYNTFPTATQRDSYRHTALGIVGTVFGLTVRAQVKKSDAGTCSAQVGIRSGSTDDYSADQFPSDASYNLANKIYEQNPATAADFTVSEVDNSELLVRRSA